MNLNEFVTYGNAKASEKKIIEAVLTAINGICEGGKINANIEISVCELEPNLNEITIRVIEGESYKKLIQMINQQIADDQKEKGGLH